MTTESKGGALRFKEPGARDTVLKKDTPSSRARTAEPEEKKNPVLEKIKYTLTHSDPDKWEKYGEELNTTGKYPKAYEKWELAYCIDLPNGLLTFRNSTPVNSEYFGGGYTITPNGNQHFTIELRPRSWDPRTLIDPFFRSTLDKDKHFKLLAEGDVARDLFSIVEKTYISFNSQKKLSISESLLELANNITAVAKESTAEVWEKSEAEDGSSTYSTLCGEISVTVSRKKKLDTFNYTLLFSRDAIKSPIKDYNLAREVYEIIDEKHKTAALEALQNVLDEAGF